MTKEIAQKKAFYTFYKEQTPEKMGEILLDGGFSHEEVRFEIISMVGQYKLFWEKKIYIAKKQLKIQPISLFIVLTYFFWGNDGRLDNWKGKIALFFIAIFVFNILSSLKTLLWDVKNYKPKPLPDIRPF